VRKWKEIIHLWNTTNMPQYRWGSLENALWLYGTTGITVHHFVTALLNEFGFADDLHMDAHLRYLYWSFDGGADNMADWREVLASVALPKFYKLIRLKPLDLIVKLFDIFAEGGSTVNCVPNDAWHIQNFDDFMKIFYAPCMTTSEKMMMLNGVEGVLQENKIDLKPLMVAGSDRERPKMDGWSYTCSRRTFKKMFKVPEGETNTNRSKTIVRFQTFAWDRLPVELHLNCFDEIQVDAMRRAEELTVKHQVRLALAMYFKSLLRKIFKEWRIVAGSESWIRKFSMKKVFQRRRLYFRFWRKLAIKKVILRRKRFLAEVMGNYIMKARYFARIRIYNYSERKLVLFANKFDPKWKTYRQGGYHLRNFWRLIGQRKALEVWWIMVKQERNEEKCEDFFFNMLMKKVIRRWHEDAKFEAHHKRQNALVMENQRQFNIKMRAAEDDGKHLVEVLHAKALREEEAKVAAREAEKLEARERAQARVRAIKKEDAKYLLNIQRDARKRRVLKQLQALKKRWKEYWVSKEIEIIEQDRLRAQEYLESEDSNLVMLMRFRKLKKDFFAPPAPENKAREDVITNPRNITFLYMEARLKKEDKTLRQIMPLFDSGKKGYLSYEEFKRMIKSLGVQLSPIQVNAVIHGVDKDGDGFIELEEMELAMRDTELMGTPGSVWRLYVDPATDVICYHNFETDQKIFEHFMTDEILEEVNVANYYGEALQSSKRRSVEMREEDWIRREKHYYAKRMQYMYRLWKGRRERSEHAWKVDTNIARENRVFQRTVIEFIERFHHSTRVRATFATQYLKTIEKVWDPEQKRMFWFNHKTKTSVWDQPYLVKRYGDTEVPPPWVVHTGQEWVERSGATPGADPQYDAVEMTTYWHAQTGVQLKRKPDGVYLCQICNYHIAMRHCNDCDIGHCFACFRERHSHPWDFFQNIKITKKMRLDPVYIAGLEMAKHTWKHVTPLRCEMCKTSKIMAAVDCKQCNRRMCRPCSRRVHEHRTASEGPDQVHHFTYF
jgi:hypothetical protein